MSIPHSPTVSCVVYYGLGQKIAINIDNTAVVTYIGSKDGARARVVHPSRTRYGYIHPSCMLDTPTTTRLSPLLCIMANATTTTCLNGEGEGHRDGLM